MSDVLLHLATTTEWREHLAAGAVAPSVAEFVHLSTPDQVALPANRLFAGRTDLNLLVLDPSRIGVEVRYEPGLPTDPASMRFPHAYGAVPTSAVLAVVPYRDAGGFAVPALPPVDAAGRQAVFEASFLRRTATREIPVTGGVAVRTDPVPASHRHNRLLVGEPADPAHPADAATVADDAARTGLSRATLTGDRHAATAAALAEAGWQVQPLVGMAGPAGGTLGRTEVVDVEALRPVWDAEWRRHGVDDAVRGQLTDRLLLEERVVDLRALALRVDGEVLASAVLRVDGATAELDGVEVVPAHRGRGHGDALLADARAIAAGAGCDLVTLTADADDHPRSWYRRRGFAEVNRLWEVTRPD